MKMDCVCTEVRNSFCGARYRRAYYSSRNHVSPASTCRRAPVKTSVDGGDSFDTPQRVGVTGQETERERTDSPKTSFLSSSSGSAGSRLQFSLPKRVQFRENDYTP